MNRTKKIRRPAASDRVTRRSAVGLTGLLLAGMAPVSRATEPAETGLRVVAVSRRPNGECVFRVTSPWQPGETLVRTLAPERLEPGERLRVLFVLPVDPGEAPRWGDGMAEIIQHQWHERHRLLVVAPTFGQLPWYANHPTDPLVRQEQYLLDGVLPLIDRERPTTGRAADRLLLGFSKSGWGAFSLLLRHPDRFGRAAAWDAPLMMAAPGAYGSGPIFGTVENFAGYHLTELLKSHAPQSGDQPRLIHLSGGNFTDHHTAFEQRLCVLRVPHIYHAGPTRKHHWNSGWIRPALHLLMADDSPASQPDQ